MAKTLTLEGDVNSVDTLVRLTAQGSVSAPSLIVPAGNTRIRSIHAALGSDNAVAGSVTGFLRIGGNAVLNGEQQIMIGGSGGQLPQSGSDQAPSFMTPFRLEDADIEVRPGDTVDIGAEMAGADVGDTTFIVTLIFSE